MDGYMAENKKDKSRTKNVPHTGSIEIFDRLFRKELTKISAGKKEKPTQRRETKMGMVKNSKSSSQFKGASRKKVIHQNATVKRKITKRFPASQGNVDTRRNVPPEKDTMLSKAVKEKTAPQLEDDKQGEITRESGLEISETKGASIEFGGKLGNNSDKLKIALLCVVLVVAVGFIINSLGVVDFPSLMGFSEPNVKGRTKTHVAQKSPQGGPSKQAPDKTPSEKRALIIKDLRQASPSKVQPLPTKDGSEPITTAKRPAITQQRYRPAVSTRRSNLVQGASTPAASKQKPVAVTKPPRPSNSSQKPVGSQKSSKTLTSKSAPVVAKKASEPVNSKAMLPGFEETPKPARQTQEEEVAAKREPPREERKNSYRYSVYLGSYPSLKRADKAISAYRQKKGVAPYLIKVDLGDKGVWYRVFVGHYKNRDEAEAFIEKKSLVNAKVINTKYKEPYSVTVDEPKKEKSSLGATALSYPYSIYLGSYQNLDHAKEAISSYQKRGLSPYWVKLDLGDKGNWYRVFMGYFRNRAQANDFIGKEHLEEAKSRHTKYANLIGTFTSQEKLDRERLRISKLGYCPYVIPAPNGELLLYVGAFYQKARAQRQHVELASGGIHSQIVER